MFESLQNILYCFCLLLVIIGLGGLLLGLLWPNEQNTEVQKLFKNEKKKGLQSAVPYTVLVREIIQFTDSMLAEKKIKVFPSFTIRYYTHKKYMGVYCGLQSEIKIYIKNHDSVPAIVNTVLHEVAHYIQQKSKAKQFKQYNSYTLHHGYYDNPLEIEARQFAKKHAADCISYLQKRNIIQ